MFEDLVRIFKSLLVNNISLSYLFTVIKFHFICNSYI